MDFSCQQSFKVKLIRIWGLNVTGVTVKSELFYGAKSLAACLKIRQSAPVKSAIVKHVDVNRSGSGNMVGLK